MHIAQSVLDISEHFAQIELAVRLPCVIGMIWFFVRDNECLKWEVRKNDSGFTVSLDHPGGSRSVQTISTPEQLLAQFHAVPQALLLAGWRLPSICRDAAAGAQL